MADIKEENIASEEKESKESEAGSEGEGGQTEKPKPKSSNKKKIIIFAILGVVLISAIAGGFIFFQHQKKQEEERKQAEISSAKSEIIYHDFDEMIINLNTENKGVSFLKIRLTLEVEGRDNLNAVVKFTPKIKDTFQLYLRELRPSDMQGSVGLYRLKDELILRINKIIYPSHVNDILFKDVLVQ